MSHAVLVLVANEFTENRLCHKKHVESKQIEKLPFCRMVLKGGLLQIRQTLYIWGKRLNHFNKLLIVLKMHIHV